MSAYANGLWSAESWEMKFPHFTSLFLLRAVRLFPIILTKGGMAWLFCGMCGRDNKGADAAVAKLREDERRISW